MSRTPAETRLLASLETLEKGGGDALQSAPHDGGFATEGTNIQSKAKAMKKALKALMKSGMSKETAEQTLKALSATSDDASSEEDVTKGGDDDSMSSDDDSGDSSSEGGDDESSEEEGEEPTNGKPFGKSHGAARLADASSQREARTNLRKSLLEEDPNAGAAFDAAPILGRLVDAVDRLSSSGKQHKSARIVREIRKSVTEIGTMQGTFNGKMAKALVMLFDKVDTINDMVKSMHDQPVPNPRGSTLRKGDVRQPDFGDGSQSNIDGSPSASPLERIDFLTIQESLVDMCMKSESGVTLDQVTRFENSKGDFSQLPEAVVRKLEQRLCAAS